MELGAAQAVAQCHPVTACDLRGDSWGSLQGLCCQGFAAWKWPGGCPRVMGMRENPRGGRVVINVCEGRSSRGASGAKVCGIGLAWVLTEAASGASQG